MDQEEQKHQINMLLTAVLMKKLGKSYDLNHDGSTKDIVIFQHDAANGDTSRIFTTTLRAKSMNHSVKQVKVTNQLINVLGDLKEEGAGDRTKVHQNVKYQFVVVEGSPSSSRASSLSTN
jgi:hypothetical protein